MMEYSDRHCRYLWRLLSRNAWLYSEMVTTGAIIHGDRQRFLQFNPEEQPVALQLGGSDPLALAQCSELAQQWGYDEVNLNCGCPSDRVQNNMIGAVLMGHADLVAQCVSAMQAAVTLPVTVKHRIGVDDMEDYDGLLAFVDTVASAGCSTFIVHARKAWLQGLSPKENREVPPLNYPLVYQMKSHFPKLDIIINGGISSIEESQLHLKEVNGVMLGRAAYYNPWLLADVDHQLYGAANREQTREQVFKAYLSYMAKEQAAGTELKHMARHVLSLFHGLAGARLFRRHISENIYKTGATISVLEDAYVKMQAVQSN